MVLEWSNHDWYFYPDEFYLQYIWTFFPLFNKVMSYMNMSATAIIRTWVERPTLRNRICQHVPKSLWNITGQGRKQRKHHYKSANSIAPCDSPNGNHLLHKQNVDFITRTTNFLFFLKQDPTSNYLSWNRFLSHFVNLIYVDRKSLFTT